MEEQPPEYACELECGVASENLPPTASVYDTVAEVGEELILSFHPYDHEGDPLEVTVDGLPRGAFLNTKSGEIRWTPTRADIGHHGMVVTVSDPTHKVSYTARVRVEPRSWEGWLVPGIGWSGVAVGPSSPVQFESGPLSLDMRERPWFHGPVFDLELWSAQDPTRTRGPGRTRLYAKLGMLRGPEQETLLQYGAGLDLSLERGTARRWVIPYYGLEVGGLRSQKVESPLRLSPHLGMWLYSDETLALQVSCGYAYALVQSEAWSGTTCSSSMHWSSW